MGNNIAVTGAFALIISAAFGVQQARAQVRSADDIVVFRRGIAPPLRDSQSCGNANPQLCTYKWVPDAWGNYDSYCSTTATRKRSLICERSDRTVAEETRCTATRPPTSETDSVTSGCVFEWKEKSYGAWSDTCSTKATRSITWECRRSDGLVMDESACTAPKPSPVSKQTTVTSGCDQVINGDFSGLASLRTTYSPLADGWYNARGASLVDTGGGNIAAKLTATGSTASEILQNFEIVKDRQYTLHVEWTGAMTSGRCSHSSYIPIALWRFPNGYEGGTKGGFVLDTTPVCGTSRYVSERTFTADYTGNTQLVIYLRSPDSGTVSAYVDNVRLTKTP